jgi:hypothetical protein
VEIFTNHADAWIAFAGMFFAAIGIYTGIRVDLKLMHERIKNAKDAQKDLQDKVDRHVENSMIHFHQRIDDTGLWPKMDR